MSRSKNNLNDYDRDQDNRIIEENDYYEYNNHFDYDQSSYDNYDNNNNENNDYDDYKMKKSRGKNNKNNNDNNNKNAIILRNADGDECVIEEQDCKISKKFIDLINSQNNVIILNEWSPQLLESVGSYFQNHQGIPQPRLQFPLRYPDMAKVCKNKFDAYFIDDVTEKNKQDLYRLLMFSLNYKIFPLYDLSCAKLASMIKGKPISQFNEILG
jgi:S-phase kinase-associated protein 1